MKVTIEEEKGWKCTLEGPGDTLPELLILLKHAIVGAGFNVDLSQDLDFTKE